MANRTKDYQDSRVARLNFAVLPSVKEDLTTLASMRRITLNELGNQIFTEYIKKYEKRLKAYNDFIAGFEEDYTKNDTPKIEQSDNPKKIASISDKQRQDAVKKIIEFLNDNQDKIINKNETETDDTVAFKIPKNSQKPACIAVISDKIKHLINDKTIKALKGNQININGKRRSGLIRIEESDLRAANSPISIK